VFAEVTSQLVGACEPPLATFPRAPERTLTYIADNNTTAIIIIIIIITTTTTTTSSSSSNGGGNYMKGQSCIEKATGVKR